MSSEKKMIEILEQIEKNTKPKDDYQIIVSNNKSDFETLFNPALELDPERKYEMALTNLETYYSFPNITEENNIIEYIVHNKTGTNIGTYKVKKIKIPVGSYELIGLNKEIQRQLKEHGDDNAFKIFSNLNTFKSMLEVKEGYTVDFANQNSLKHILGFTKNHYHPGIHHSENIVEIMEINSIFIHVSDINGSIVNGAREPVIYSFFPKVSPGHKIVERPINLIYLPVYSNNIRYFHVKITNQNNKPLNLRGEEITITFHIRQK